MKEDLIKKIINNKNSKSPKAVDDSHSVSTSGYFMMQATTVIDKHKFKSFYAVPESMRKATNQDKSILETSTNIRNLYEVDHDEYEKNQEIHNQKAEGEFSGLVKASQTHLDKFKLVSKLLKEQSQEEKYHQIK